MTNDFAIGDFPKGDVSADGEVTLADLVLALQIAAGRFPGSDDHNRDRCEWRRTDRSGGRNWCITISFRCPMIISVR
ncbi:MAG: hypothetical protein B6245_20175 [Desulfobacteraceae bacterium 4572_88]|nr:MAG: hypothetical protein B6245_20175 [Desulfobacteraceae bacterium 4572_88]